MRIDDSRKLSIANDRNIIGWDYDIYWLIFDGHYRSIRSEPVNWKTVKRINGRWSLGGDGRVEVGIVLDDADAWELVGRLGRAKGW